MLRGCRTIVKLFAANNEHAAAAFHQERDIYHVLETERLQGVVAPELLLSGAMQDDLVLVLSHCGNALSQGVRPRMANRATKALQILHAHGVLHGNVRLEKFVHDPVENRVKIVDFAGAQVSHDAPLFEAEKAQLRGLLGHP